MADIIIGWNVDWSDEDSFVSFIKEAAKNPENKNYKKELKACESPDDFIELVGEEFNGNVGLYCDNNYLGVNMGYETSAGSVARNFDEINIAELVTIMGSEPSIHAVENADF